MAKQAIGSFMLDVECPGCSNDGWHMMGMSVWWILLFIIVVAVTLLILWYLLQSNTPSYEEELDDPVSILKKRYARGEISKEEYEIKLKDLSSEEQ